MATEPPVYAPRFKDTKGRLVVVGVFEIIGAAFCMLMLATAVVGKLLAPRAREQPSIATFAVLIVALTALLLILGVGSINTRRWARAIGLCVGWIGLVVGIVGVGFIIASIPALRTLLQSQAQATGRPLPVHASNAVVIVIVATVTFFYVVIPGALVLFYRGDNVRRTCEARDTKPRWTDRVPLPILATVLINAGTALALLCTIPTYGRACLVFGALLVGHTAIAVYVLLTALFVYLTAGLYRIDRRAYWIYLASTLILAVNAWMSFRSDGLMRLYRALDLPAVQLNALAKSPFMTSGAVGDGVVASSIAMLLWALWLKRYFTDATPPPLTANTTVIATQ